jgi:hypothetical protein
MMREGRFVVCGDTHTARAASSSSGILLIIGDYNTHKELPSLYLLLAAAVETNQQKSSLTKKKKKNTK